MRGIDNHVYGPKQLYFDDVCKTARFVNLYRDLFIGKWCVEDIETSTGSIIYELSFLMNHQDLNTIRKSIKTQKKSFRPGQGYRVTREFVV